METLGFANTMLGTTGTLAILSAAPGGEIKGALMANVETECNKNPPGELAKGAKRPNDILLGDHDAGKEEGREPHIHVLEHAEQRVVELNAESLRHALK